MRKVVNKDNWIAKVGRFYLEGFRGMTLGKTLWMIILVKVFIIFFIMRVFFFPNFIGQHADDGKEADFVSKQIINRAYD